MSTAEFNTALIELEPNLERFAYSLTANPEDAHDLVQETFLKALTYRDKFADNTNIKAWTFTIMKNTFINNYRKAVKQRTTFDSSDNQFLINGRAHGESPESSYSHSEINQKIENLDDDFRIPFQMHTSCLLYTSVSAEDRRITCSSFSFSNLPISSSRRATSSVNLAILSFATRRLPSISTNS